MFNKNIRQPKYLTEMIYKKISYSSQYTFENLLFYLQKIY